MSEETTFHVRNAIAGDDKSIGWLVGRLSPLLKHQALYRLGAKVARAVDPEDIVAEAWLATLPKLKGLEIRGERATPILLGYLGTVVRNLANDRLRRYALRGPAEAQAGSTASLSPEIASASMVAMIKEEALAVEKCLTQLSDDEREIIILRAVEGIPNKEVASDLGLEPATASKRYRRALERLRSQLGDSVFSELPAPDDGHGS